MSNFLGVSEYAQRLGVTKWRVRALLRQDRIKGAKRVETGKTSVWIIPENAPDPRKPAGRPPGRKK